MPKMHYSILVTNFQKSPIGDMKLGDLTKLWFFKLIVTKSNLKKSGMTSFCDVIVIMSAK